MPDRGDLQLNIIPTRIKKGNSFSNYNFIVYEKISRNLPNKLTNFYIH